MTDNPLKQRSRALTDGFNRAGARSMLRAAGLKDEDFEKPLIGVANTWIEIGPCNYHLRELAVHVKDGIRAAGGTPLEFNTVSISDGITMGTEGMRASLISREVIADSIELVTRGNMFDALIVLVGCDKTIPAGAMALARLNIPGLDALRRLDRSRSLQWPLCHHSRRLRSHRRAFARKNVRPGTEGTRMFRLPRRGRVRRPIHRQHHGARLRISRPRAHGHFQRSGDRTPAKRTPANLPANLPSTCFATI